MCVRGGREGLESGTLQVNAQPCWVSPPSFAICRNDGRAAEEKTRQDGRRRAAWRRAGGLNRASVAGPRVAA